MAGDVRDAGARTDDLDAFTAHGSLAHRVLLSRVGGGVALGLAVLYAAVTVLAPVGSSRLAPALLALVALGAVPVLLLRPGRLPLRLMDAALIAASLLICWIALDDALVAATAPFSLLGLNLLAFGVRRPAATVLLAGSSVVGYLAVVLWGPELAAPLAHWLAYVLALATSGAMIQWLVQKVRRFVASEVEAQRDAERASAALAVVNEEKNAFLGRMSHELRTPLNAVLGFAGVLRGGLSGPLTERQEGYVKDIADAGQHLLSLVDDVLDLSRIEGGDVLLELTEFDLRDVVDESLRLIRGRAARAGLRLRLELSTRETRLTGDERKVRQVIVNLLSNAVRFTPAGGRVTVYVDGDRQRLRLAIRDTGVGIQPHDLDRIFAEYQQATVSADGTGLGLPLARRYAEAHGGTLEVASRPGTGSVFTVELPRHLDEAAVDVGALPAPQLQDESFDAFTAPNSEANRALVGRTGTWYCLCAGLFGPVLALLTPASWGSRLLVTGVCLAAVASTLFHRRFSERSHAHSVDVTGRVGILLISLVTLAPTPLHEITPLLYVWIATTSFVLWSSARGFQQLLLIGGAYAIVLVLRPADPTAPARWCALMVGLAIVGGVCNWMATTLRRMVVAERAARLRAEAARARLADASRHKSAFLASMSHELRAPLNAIIGFSDVLVELDGHDLDPRQREYAAEIGDAGRQLLVLINDILDLAKLQAGQLVLVRAPTSAATLVQGVVSAAQDVAAARSVELATSVPDADLVVDGDGRRLHQGLGTIVRTVVLAAAPGAVVRVAVSTDPAWDTLEIRIERDGVPASTPEHERVVEVLQGTSLAAIDGAGVAAALARGLVELHGGGVSAGPDAASVIVRLPVGAALVGAP